MQGRVPRNLSGNHDSATRDKKRKGNGVRRNPLIYLARHTGRNWAPLGSDNGTIGRFPLLIALSYFFVQETFLVGRNLRRRMIKSLAFRRTLR